MDPIIEGKIEAVRSEVARSDMTDPEKDAAQGMLDHAAIVSNGTPDKIAAMARAQADQIMRDIRRDIRSPAKLRAIVEDVITEHEARSGERLGRLVSDAVAAAVEGHVKECAARHGKNAEEGGTQTEAALGPVLQKIGALGRFYGRLPSEGRVGVVVAVLYILNRYGLEQFLGWLGKGLALLGIGS